MAQRKSAVYGYFVEEETRFICAVEKDGKICNSAFAKNKSDGSSSGNLKRHLKRSHSQEHDEVMKKDEACKRPALERGQTQLQFNRQPSTSSITVPMMKADLETGILQMVAYDGVPLTFFTRPGFQTINGAAAKRLGVSIGEKAVRKLVLDRAALEKEKLSKELEGKFFTLKFDGATRLRSHYLGITVQFYGDEGLKVRTLALVDTQAHHNSQHLKDIVLSVMREYRLSLSHCLACVVDNASNMTKTIKLLNEEKHVQDSEKGDGEEEDQEEDQEEEEEEEEEEMRFPNIDASIHHMRFAILASVQILCSLQHT